MYWLNRLPERLNRNFQPWLIYLVDVLSIMSTLTISFPVRIANGIQCFKIPTLTNKYAIPTQLLENIYRLNIGKKLKWGPTYLNFNCSGLHRWRTSKRSEHQ